MTPDHSSARRADDAGGCEDVLLLPLNLFLPAREDRPTASTDDVLAKYQWRSQLEPAKSIDRLGDPSASDSAGQSPERSWRRPARKRVVLLSSSIHEPSRSPRAWRPAAARRVRDATDTIGAASGPRGKAATGFSFPPPTFVDSALLFDPVDAATSAVRRASITPGRRSSVAGTKAEHALGDDMHIEGV